MQQAALRDHYPVPAILVISGRLGLGKANLSGLRESLGKNFWHGQMIPKGIEESEAIDKAIAAARQYCDVGLHLRDAGGKLCPTLSPREEDLIRRCVLGDPLCIGLDLEWWGSYIGASPSIARTAVEKKILMGKFLLKDGLESSLPSFFKFEDADTASHTHKAAVLMTQKLRHIKLIAPSPVRSSSRSLLVTQQVGGSSGCLISLSDLLTDSSDNAFKAIPRIVTDTVPEFSEFPSFQPPIRNTLQLILEVRRLALKSNDCKVYALIVFDYVMLQLGGLAVQTQGNKITNPKDVVTLANLTANWLLSIAPWFGKQAATE